MVAKAANAPVFCLWDTIMGWDTIGGSLLSFEAQGAYAAKTALAHPGQKDSADPAGNYPSQQQNIYVRLAAAKALEVERGRFAQGKHRHKQKVNVLGL